MIAIIDGDVLCYQACKPRWEKKARIEDGISYVQLDEAGKRIPLEYTMDEDREYLKESWSNLQKDLETLLDGLSALVGREIMLQIYKKAVETEYSFLYINLMEKDVDFMFYKNFNKRLIPASEHFI